jgi:type III pantothenate kinase
MILTIDIGNSSSSLAIFKGDRIIRRDRLETAVCSSVAALSRILRDKLGSRVEGISGISIASVVPALDSIFRGACEKTFSSKPLFVTHKNAGVKVFGKRPGQAGADRLANIAEAYARFGKAVIVVDFGTATTLDVVTPEGEFIGGAIAPGIELASQALSDAAARLPRVSFKRPDHVVGRNTVECMQAGLFHGYIGMVDHLVKESVRELGSKCKVIATGGFAKIISSESKVIDDVDIDLTLKGIHRIWRRNRS